MSTLTSPPVPGCLVITDDPSASISAIGNPGVDEVGHLGEEREVAAGGLDAAFDDVAGGDGTGERVVVGAAPAEVRGGRSDDHRRVGDPAGDDDVGAGVEAVDDAPRAEVGVGGERGAEAEFGGPADEVVALDVGDVRVESEPFGQRRGRRRPARRD